jgi:hypothetical protein
MYSAADTGNLLIHGERFCPFVMTSATAKKFMALGVTVQRRKKQVLDWRAAK